MKVSIESPCSASVIIQHGIKNWPIWESEPSKFPWHYVDKEICFIIEGEAIIKTEDGTIYNIRSGDLVKFPQGITCEWEITRKIKKHYRLGD